MSIKKAYIEIIELLEANSDKKVKTILDDVRALCTSKNKGGSEIGTTFAKDETGNTFAIYCYYFKKWFNVNDIEVGTKANTASGYNTMCKEGVRNWTRQQRVAKQEKAELLEKIANLETPVEDLSSEMEAIETKRKEIVEPEEPLLFFDTLEDLLASKNLEDDFEDIE